MTEELKQAAQQGLDALLTLKAAFFKNASTPEEVASGCDNGYADFEAAWVEPTHAAIAALERALTAAQPAQATQTDLDRREKQAKLRKALQHHGLTRHGDGVVEADIMAIFETQQATPEPSHAAKMLKADVAYVEQQMAAATPEPEWETTPKDGEQWETSPKEATPEPTTPQPLGYIPTDAIDQIKTPPRLITHKVPVLSYAAEGYTAIYTHPAPGVPDGVQHEIAAERDTLRAEVEGLRVDAERWHAANLTAETAWKHPDHRSPEENTAFSAYRCAVEDGLNFEGAVDAAVAAIDTARKEAT